MKRWCYILQILVLVFIISGCSSSDPIITDEAAYVESIEEWQHLRMERLKSKNGWLNLAGLFWLEEGENSFGSDPSNLVVFPDKADAFCGTLTLNDSKVFMHVRDRIKIGIGDSLVTKADLIHDQAKIPHTCSRATWHGILSNGARDTGSG